MDGIGELLGLLSIDPTTVAGVGWCAFQDTNLDFGGAVPTLAIVHPGGVVCSTGKKKMFGGAIKFDAVDFADVQRYASINRQPETGDPFGRYGITFLGPGEIVLGSLTWQFPVKRFRDSRSVAMAAASDRDRVYAILSAFLQ